MRLVTSGDWFHAGCCSCGMYRSGAPQPPDQLLDAAQADVDAETGTDDHRRRLTVSVRYLRRIDSAVRRTHHRPWSPGALGWRHLTR